MTDQDAVEAVAFGNVGNFPKVQGRCPSCGRQSLFLASGGYVTCSIIGCASPDAATVAIEAYEAHRPAETVPARVETVDELRRAMSVALLENPNVPTEDAPGLMGQEDFIWEPVPMFYVTDTCAEVAATVLHLAQAPAATVSAEIDWRWVAGYLSEILYPTKRPDVVYEVLIEALLDQVAAPVMSREWQIAPVVRCPDCVRRGV